MENGEYPKLSIINFQFSINLGVRQHLIHAFLVRLGHYYIDIKIAFPLMVFLSKYDARGCGRV